MIAPHEYNEVDLVLNGAKPLATIERRKDYNGYRTAVQLISEGVLAGKASSTVDSPEGEVVLTLPENQHLIEKYQHLLLHGVQELGIKEYHRAMGRMFGYDSESIEEFINAEINCDCRKCTGA